MQMNCEFANYLDLAARTTRPGALRLVAASRSRAAAVGGECWSRRHRRLRARRVLCAPSTSGLLRVAGSISWAVAAARKLAMVIWHMLSKDSDYI
ncbi:hypothetical protein X739_32315 [Mesorhizobium sp. LNHC220B00]|nr:hypothetical protein X739_32315 [Mesorhizobium sp. LNHC220B00]